MTETSTPGTFGHTIGMSRRHMNTGGPTERQFWLEEPTQLVSTMVSPWNTKSSMLTSSSAGGSEVGETKGDDNEEDARDPKAEKAGSQKGKESRKVDGGASEGNDGEEGASEELRTLMAARRYPIEPTLEQERRRAVAALRDTIAAEDGQNRLAISEATLLLFLANWDFEEAQTIARDPTRRREVLSELFDRLRNAPDSITQDEQLAYMIGITGRAD